MDDEIKSQTKDISTTTNLKSITGTSLLLILLAEEIYQRKIKTSYLWRIGKMLLPGSFRQLRRGRG